MSAAHDFHNREDGLAHCKVCGGAEGSLPTNCPGVPMTAAEQDSVMAGTLDFRKGCWWTTRLNSGQADQTLADQVAEHMTAQQTSMVRATVAAVMEAAGVTTLSMNIDRQSTIWDRVELFTDRNDEHTHVTFTLTPR